MIRKVMQVASCTELKAYGVSIHCLDFRFVICRRLYVLHSISSLNLEALRTNGIEKVDVVEVFEKRPRQPPQCRRYQARRGVERERTTKRMLVSVRPYYMPAVNTKDRAGSGYPHYQTSMSTASGIHA